MAQEKFMDAKSEVPTTRSANQLDSRGPVQDRIDAEQVHAIFAALKPVVSSWPKGTKRLGVVKRALREAIQKIWQEPRMPKANKSGGKDKLIFSHNKPLAYPWSPNARDLYFAHRADPSVIISNQLVLEHVVPMGTLVDEILQKMDQTSFGKDEFVSYLIAKHNKLSFVVLTREDDNAISKAKYKNRIVDEPGATEWARYEKGCGLMEDDFLAVTADDRFEDLAVSVS